MKAESDVYVKLQSIYKAKARKDAAEVLEIVRVNPAGKNIEKVEVDAFCKNAAFIKLIRASESVSNLQKLASKFLFHAYAVSSNAFIENELYEGSLLPIYLALSATSHFDLASKSDILSDIESKLPGTSENEQIVEAATEVARAKGGELHNISSLTGGMVAQEVIKIITKQYIPVDNLCVFDGIKSKAQIFRL